MATTTLSSSNKKAIAGVLACWVAFIATVACNLSFEISRLGGVTTAEVSNQVVAWFTPAGYVFTIWGVIYAALAVWLITETNRAMKGNAIAPWQMGLFVLSCGLNIGWLAAFHMQQIVISLLLILALWTDLAVLYVGLRDDPKRTYTNLAPFSVYFAWITVALVANATHLAARLTETPVIVNQVSTIALTATVLFVACLAVRNSHDYVFPIVILWATIGVGVRLMGIDSFTSIAVIMLTALGAVIAYMPLITSSPKPMKHVYDSSK